MQECCTSVTVSIVPAFFSLPYPPHRLPSFVISTLNAANSVVNHPVAGASILNRRGDAKSEGRLPPNTHPIHLPTQPSACPCIRSSQLLAKDAKANTDARNKHDKLHSEPTDLEVTGFNTEVVRVHDRAVVPAILHFQVSLGRSNEWVWDGDWGGDILHESLVQ